MVTESGSSSDSELVDPCKPGPKATWGKSEYGNDQLRITLGNRAMLIAHPDFFPYTQERELYIDSVSVDKEFQGHGLGTKLMRKAGEEAERMKFPIVVGYFESKAFLRLLEKAFGRDSLKFYSGRSGIEALKMDYETALAAPGYFTVTAEVEKKGK